MIEAYQRSPEWRKLSKTTQWQYTHYLKPLWRVGHANIRDVKRRELRLARDAIAAERGAGAAFGFARAVSALFRWAVNNDWLDFSPATQLGKGLPHGHLRAWTQEEANVALERLSEDLRRAVLLALYTGQRRGDLCALRWSAFDGESIKVKQQKTGAELTIPCHPVLKAELLAWKAQAKAVTILTGPRGLPWRPNMLSHYLPNALVKIGLTNEINIHGLRKLAAANLAEAGCSVSEIAAVTGHATLAMVQLYTASADQKRLATAAIVRLTNRKE